MGKRIITQRRGRGTSRYKAPSYHYKYPTTYPKLRKEPIKGKVIKLIKDPARPAPTAVIRFEDKSEVALPAPFGIREGQEITYGGTLYKQTGNILRLADLPEGTSVYNIEKLPGSGGTYCRSAGTTAKILSKTENYVLVQLPSKKQKKFSPECRAIVGEVAGTGKLEKPIVKAGKRHHIMKARNKLYPLTSGVAMNAVDHPFGSGRGRHIGKSKIPPRNAPPGRNVGLIRAKRTGKKK